MSDSPQSGYVGIAPPQVRDFAGTMRAASEDARGLALEMDRLLAEAQLTSDGPALAADVARTLATGADILEQRATLADLCRPNPTGLETLLDASRAALRAMEVDGQTVAATEGVL
jgi:hypothetical protein